MLRCRAAALALILVISGAALAAAPSNCAPDGVQSSGSIYRICMPAGGSYNGMLVLWAHGFQDAGTPVGIPEDQLCANGICLDELINSLGFAFATNSYSKTGMAILQGKQDLLELVGTFTALHGPPSKVYIVGASEGGIITALSVEQYPAVYDAGVAACGPVGDFPAQIAYFGDARATFQYFFPNVIPGPPFDPAPALVAAWSDYYDLIVKPVITHPLNASRLSQWAAVAKLPADAGNWLATVEQSARDVLRYSVVNLRDASATIGGFPYGNRLRWYSGSADDVALNRAVPRVDASPFALYTMMSQYNTTGRLSRPLVTMHTLRDQQVPYWHEDLYALKTLVSGALVTRHYNIPVDRYGHCKFMPDEMLYAFFVMLLYDELIDTAAASAPTIDAARDAAIRERVRAALAPWRNGSRGIGRGGR